MIPAEDCAAALHYAQTFGWAVLPLHSVVDGCCTCSKGESCDSPAKHPRTAHGVRDASSDPAQITDWWRRWPRSNVGIRTGTHFDALDIDAAGLGTVLDLAGAHGPLPPGPTVSTPGGGLHLYFSPTGLGCPVGFVSGCDWRGANGYIIAPPSLHVSGGRYVWLTTPPPGERAEDRDGPEPASDEEMFEPAPDWLVALVRHRGAPPMAAGPAAAPPSVSPGDRRAAYGRRALEAECGRVTLAAEGTRNDQLNRSAHALGQLVGAGVLSAVDVADTLVLAAVRAGLGEQEARRTIASGLRAGLGKPRGIPA